MLEVAKDHQEPSSIHNPSGQNSAIKHSFPASSSPFLFYFTSRLRPASQQELPRAADEPALTSAANVSGAWWLTVESWLISVSHTPWTASPSSQHRDGMGRGRLFRAVTANLLHDLWEGKIHLEFKAAISSFQYACVCMSIKYIYNINPYKNIKHNKKGRGRGVCKPCRHKALEMCSKLYNYHSISSVFGHKSSGLNCLASRSVSLRLFLASQSSEAPFEVSKGTFL